MLSKAQGQDVEFLGTEADARLIAAAPALRRAWEMIPGPLQEKVYKMLQETGEGWVQEAIVAVPETEP